VQARWDGSIFDCSADMGSLFHKIFDMVCLNAGHAFFRCRRLRLSARQAAEKEWNKIFRNR
jgi:hypothetical protein